MHNSYYMTRAKHRKQKQLSCKQFSSFNRINICNPLHCYPDGWKLHSWDTCWPLMEGFPQLSHTHMHPHMHTHKSTHTLTHTLTHTHMRPHTHTRVHTHSPRCSC